MTKVTISGELPILSMYYGNDGELCIDTGEYCISNETTETEKSENPCDTCYWATWREEACACPVCFDYNQYTALDALGTPPKPSPQIPTRGKYTAYTNKEGQFHNLEGPAVTFNQSEVELYFIDGVQFTKEQWNVLKNNK